MEGTGIRILTFDWHEAYLHLLSGTGHQFFIFEPLIAPNSYRRWQANSRPVPENATIITPEEMERKLDSGGFDLIICHNLKDVMAVAKWSDTPKICIFHNKLSSEIALGGNPIDRREYIADINPYLRDIELVFISQGKMDDWGIGRGRVIMPGVDIDLYGGYVGDLKTILCIGNRLRERDIVLGFTQQQAICKGMPITLLGENPALQCRTSQSWEDLKKHYRHCRVYLGATQYPMEDGYNLAMLEAMATGMPILSYANPTSPIEDGREGFQSGDIETLRHGAQELLADQDKAVRMGGAAKEKVADLFPIRKFYENWNEVIETTAKKRSRPVVVNKPAEVWMDFVSYPVTTANYIKRAFAKSENIITSGGKITEEIMKLWNLGNMKAPVLNQDIPRIETDSARYVMDKLPKGFNPDFFLWVETGIAGPPTGMEDISIPKAAYFIGTHLNFDTHIQLAGRFDLVFLAQREYMDRFREAGIKSVHWLPLACDPEIHGEMEMPRTNDIGFVGSITPAHTRRKQLLERLQLHFDVKTRRVFLDEMKAFHSSCKIVFNNAIRNDLNMRVFEVLCSGALLLTDDSVGQSDFFEDGKHFALYSDENIIDKARYYLQNDREREEIAARGRKAVLAEHTYMHRVRQIIKIVNEQRGTLSIKSVGKQENPLEPNDHIANKGLEVMEMVPAGVKRILEIGCGEGALGKALKELDPEREVVGVELGGEAARTAETVLDKVFNVDLERFDPPYPNGYFDCIIYADVLERLREPEALIRKHKRLLSPTGIMVMNIPNTRHFTLVNDLLEGRWRYSDGGPIDKAHLRFFTLSEIRDMLTRCGLVPTSIKGKLEGSNVDDMYKEGLSGTLKIGRWQIENLTPEEMHQFFVHQYFITAGVSREAEEAVVAPDAGSPDWFRSMIDADSRFDSQTSEPFISSGHELKMRNDSKAIVLVGALKETDSEKLLWVGHFNMALSRFDQAEEIYRKLGNKKYIGCVLAAQGFMHDALKNWWAARDDAEAAGWFERHSVGDAQPEKVALLPIESGRGIRLGVGETHDVLKERLSLDYITSHYRLEEGVDTIEELNLWRDHLRPGGLLGLVCRHHSSDRRNVYPAPRHQFNADGLRRLIDLVVGLSVLGVREILEDSSFLMLVQKEPVTTFDYDENLKQLSMEGVMQKSIAYWDKGMIEASAQCSRMALVNDPDNAIAHSKLGDCLQRQNNSAAAIGHYKKAMAISNSESPYIGMASLYLSKNEIRQAEELFEKAVKINPENDRAVYGLGMARYQSGKKEIGFELYERSLQINPENLVALKTLVQSAYELKKLDVAEKSLKTYLDLHPANVEILYSLAAVLYSQNKIAEARDALDRLMIFKPDHADARELYGKIASAGAKSN